jgi:hypothetical protein
MSSVTEAIPFKNSYSVLVKLKLHSYVVNGCECEAAVCGTKVRRRNTVRQTKWQAT